MVDDARKLLPVLIPGTNMLVEPRPCGLFVETTVRKSFLQVLCEEAPRRGPERMLVPFEIDCLWNTLRLLYEDGAESFGFAGHDPEREKCVRNFFRHEYLPIGVESVDLEHTLRQLHWEMRCTTLYANALWVYEGYGLEIENFHPDQLPKEIRQVGVKTQGHMHADPEFGASLSRFREAGGRLVVNGTSCNAPSYGNASDVKINSLMWWLGNCPVDGPTGTYDPRGIGFRGDSIGVLRGRSIDSIPVSRHYLDEI